MYTAWNIDMLLTVASFLPFFLPSKREKVYFSTVENEVSASSTLTFYKKNQLLIGQDGSSRECLKSDTRTTPTCQYPHIGMYIIMTAGRPVDWCSRRALISSAFPYSIYIAYRFLRGNLCLVPVRRLPGLLGQFTTVISPGRTGGKRLTSSPGLSDPKRIGRPE